MVDAARMPVYFATEFHQLAHVWTYLVIGTIGVIVGTVLGQQVLIKIPEKVSRRIVSFIILTLGIVLVIDPVL